MAALARGDRGRPAVGARLRGSALGRRRPARLRRPPRRLGERGAAARPVHRATGAAHAASRLGRRQGQLARRSRLALSTTRRPRRSCTRCSGAPRSRPTCRRVSSSTRAGIPSMPRSSRGCSLERPGDVVLPESVQGIIAARLDTLPREEKELLQDAAVVGRVFWLGALGDGPSAARGASALARAKGVRKPRVAEARSPTRTSTRSVTRSSARSPTSRCHERERAEKHRSAAEWIESLGRQEDHAEMLAHHYEAALELRAARQVRTPSF